MKQLKCVLSCMESHQRQTNLRRKSLHDTKRMLFVQKRSTDGSGLLFTEAHTSTRIIEASIAISLTSRKTLKLLSPALLLNLPTASQITLSSLKIQLPPQFFFFQNP